MKLLRVETRSGQVRFVALGPYPHLPAWVETMRRDGWLVGPEWAMPFDAVSLVDLVEASEQPSQNPSQQNDAAAAPPRPGGCIAAAIAAGQWPYKIVE
jgi:hypothetical protein